MRKEVEAKERSFAIGACFNDCNEIHEKFNFSSSALLSQSKNLNKHRCVFCNKNNHTSNIYLKTSNPITRKKIAKQKRLCFLCLEKGHSAVSCKLKYSGNKCGGKHKLRKDLEQLREYDKIINDYLKDGILEEVSPINKTDAVHYLPHQAEVKKDRETTKARIIFDASAKYLNEKSLNDMLDPGPCLLPRIFDILVRFRLGKIGIIADIKKAFLQIAIDEDHRDFLRMIGMKMFLLKILR